MKSTILATLLATGSGLAQATPGHGESVREFIERKMYYPEYVPIYSDP